MHVCACLVVAAIHRRPFLCNSVKSVKKFSFSVDRKIQDCIMPIQKKDERRSYRGVNVVQASNVKHVFVMSLVVGDLRL